MTDLYRILGVARDASQADIKASYRRLARKHHPDVSASPDANQKFARINEAYYVLSDPRRREMYDLGFYDPSPAQTYAQQQAEAVAMQRKFDQMVDEMLAAERQAAAQRSHAVLLVVPLFLSGFYVMLIKPTFIERASLLGKAAIIGLGVCGIIYVIRNLAIVLSRYTYEVPARVTSVLRDERPRDKVMSRQAALFFLVSGYLVSVGLGYVVGKLIPLLVSSRVSVSALLGVVIYPPIAVLIIGAMRRLRERIDWL